VEYQYSLNFAAPEAASVKLDEVTDPIERELLQDVRGSFGPHIGKLCFVDTETTGAYALNERIIEIALIKFTEVSPENWRLEKYVALVNPEGRKSHPGALRVHKIPDEWLVTAKTFREQAAEIRSFLGDRRLVAQNAGFDRSFLQNEFCRIGETISNKWFCSRKHFKRFNPDLVSYGLEKVCRHYGITYVAHRAEADALAIIRAFHRSGAIKGHRFSR
jgi:DNA polymerase III epsilon subunit-like protein